MKIRAHRCLKAFPPALGYELAWKARTGGDGMCFGKGSVAGLYEQVRIVWGGRLGEAVGGYVRISVVRGRAATKGLVEEEFLAELATDLKWGYALIEDREAAIEWERRLASIAPERVARLARDRGPQLLERTAGARAAAQTYCGCLPVELDLSDLQTWLLARARPEQVEEASRLENWAGVVHFEEGRPAYRAATLGLAMFGESIDGGRFFGADPLETRELMWRIQILVDALVNRKQGHRDFQGIRNRYHRGAPKANRK